MVRQLRTGAWYGDEELRLDFPTDWDVEIFWPDTPPPLSTAELGQALEAPSGQAPLRELCRGKKRPLVVVDDLNRPTPVERVMPFVLSHFRDAGISPEDVTVVMGAGTHGAPKPGALEKKVGSEAAARCRLVAHDSEGSTVHLGKTSRGTPVYANPLVSECDFLVGIGGIYPNGTAGFGGGSKLSLGILAFRTIRHLHYRHEGVGWGDTSKVNPFRDDLDEICRMMGMRTIVSLHVDSDREVVRIDCGDPDAYYAGAVAFAKRCFRAPLPRDAQVVIANAYPNDTSFTFATMKGNTPLAKCPAGVSRILLASCDEGAGHHGLFPKVNVPWNQNQLVVARRLITQTPAELAQKISGRIASQLHRPAPSTPEAPSGAAPKPEGPPKNPIWLLRTRQNSETVPLGVPGVRTLQSWGAVVQAVQKEQGSARRLRTLVYPCAPLQWIDAEWSAAAEAARTA